MTGKHDVVRPSDIGVCCNAQSTVQVKKTSSSDTLGIRVHAGPGQSTDGRYTQAADERTAVPVRYTVDSNVGAPGSKTANVVYTLSVL